MDDGGRAKRARQRAEEERREREEQISERDESQNETRKILTALHRDSCHPLSGIVSTTNVVLVTFFTAMVFVAMVPFVAENETVAKLASEPVQFAAAFCVVFAVGLVGTLARIAVASAARRAYRAELQWLRSLPFAVENLEQGVITSTSDKHLVVIIPDVRPPPSVQIMPMLSHVDPGGSIETRYDELRIKARVAGDSENDVARVRARRLLFRDLVDAVLLPLHAQLPFQRIRTDAE